MDKDINFGEQSDAHKFTNVTAANSQNYTFVDGPVISFALFSNEIDFFFETDADVDSDSFMVKKDVVYVENLLAATIYVKAVSGAGAIWLRGIR